MTSFTPASIAWIRLLPIACCLAAAVPAPGARLIGDQYVHIRSTRIWIDPPEGYFLGRGGNTLVDSTGSVVMDFEELNSPIGTALAPGSWADSEHLIGRDSGVIDGTIYHLIRYRSGDGTELWSYLRGDSNATIGIQTRVQVSRAGRREDVMGSLALLKWRRDISPDYLEGFCCALTPAPGLLPAGRSRDGHLYFTETGRVPRSTTEDHLLILPTGDPGEPAGGPGRLAILKNNLERVASGSQAAVVWIDEVPDRAADSLSITELTAGIRFNATGDTTGLYLALAGIGSRYFLCYGVDGDWKDRSQFRRFSATVSSLAPKTASRKQLEDLVAGASMGNDMITRLLLGTSLQGQTPHDPYAVPALTRVIELSPGLSTAYFSRGRVHQMRGDDSLALADLTKALELSPDSRGVHQWRGEAYLALGSYGAALADFDTALTHDKPTARVLVGRGRALAGLYRAREAREEFDRAVGIDETFAAGYYYRGKASAVLGEFESALEDLGDAADRGVAEKFLVTERARIEAALGDTVAADRDYTAAIALDTTSASRFAARARFRFSRGDFRGAIGDLTESCRLDRSRYHRIWLSLALRAGGRSADAEAVLADAVAKEADFTGSRFGTAIARFFLGELTAEQLLTLAEREGDQSVLQNRCEAAFYVGMASFLTGDRPGARRRWEECLATGVDDYVEHEYVNINLRHFR